MKSTVINECQFKHQPRSHTFNLLTLCTLMVEVPSLFSPIVIDILKDGLYGY